MSKNEQTFDDDQMSADVNEIYDILTEEKQYLRDRRLPRADAAFDWTSDMAVELIKCKDNILYFAENYFYIINLDEGKQKIKLYQPQKKILKSLDKNRFVVVCSSRQAGKTTLVCIYALWYTLFNDDKRVVIVANKEGTAINILKRVALAYKQLPNWLKSGVKQFAKKEIIFANDSSIAISTTTASSIRGESINCLIVDELAHIENTIAEEFWASVIPTISSSMKTKVFAVSTPKGTNNLFHRIYMSAINNTDYDNNMKWQAEKIHWYELPNRGKKWKEAQIALLGGDEQLFEQEFNNVFLDSGNIAVDFKLLESLERRCKRPIIAFDDGHYRLWANPEENRLYAIGVDVGEGVNKSASVAQVLDFTDLSNIQQVAIYHDNLVDTTHFAFKLHKIGLHWGCPPMIIERNNCGLDVINTLYNIHNYFNLVSFNKTENKLNSNKLGVFSNVSTKHIAIMNMRYWMNSLKQVIIYDFHTIHELKTFVKHDNGTWSKQKGNNIYDDRVMSLAWALLLLHEEICTRYYDIAEYDKNGKPSVLRNYTVESPGLIKLDDYYQNINADVLPISFGMSSEFNKSDDYYSLLSKGWLPIKTK